MPRLAPKHGFDLEGPSRQACSRCGKFVQKSYFSRHHCTDRLFKRRRHSTSLNAGTGGVISCLRTLNEILLSLGLCYADPLTPAVSTFDADSETWNASPSLEAAPAGQSSDQAGDSQSHRCAHGQSATAKAHAYWYLVGIVCSD